MGHMDDRLAEEKAEMARFCQTCPLRGERGCRYGEAGLFAERNARDRIIVRCLTVTDRQIVEKHGLHEPVNPCPSCDKKRECDQLPGDVSWKCKRNREYILAMEKYYMTPMGYTPPESISCGSCAMYFVNKYPQYVRRAKTVRKDDTFCHMSLCRVGVRDMRKHSFPVWCQRVRDKESCSICGTPVFYNENGICPRCAREEKRQLRGY